MNETLACSGCGRFLHVPDELLGQAVKCPACHHTFTAPVSGFAGGSQPPTAPPYEAPPPQPATVYPESEVYDNRPRAPYANGEELDDAPYRGPRYDKPGKVQAIAIMTLAGGIIALLCGLAWASTCIGLVLPPTYYSFVLGVMAIIKGSNLLGDSAYRESPPRAIAIMQIINILSLDVINVVLGIVTLVFLNDPAVKAYFRR
jgi:hypothetical protein